MATFASFWRHGSNTVLLRRRGRARRAVRDARARVRAGLARRRRDRRAGVLRLGVHDAPLHAPRAAEQERVRAARCSTGCTTITTSSPRALDLLFLPLWFAIPVAALDARDLLRGHARARAPAPRCCSGSVLGLLWYEWVHYVAHIPFVPKTPFGRWIKKYHLWHHFKNERMWFGVTNPSMDFVGRTYARVDEVEPLRHDPRPVPEVKGPSASCDSQGATSMRA